MKVLALACATLVASCGVDDPQDRVTPFDVEAASFHVVTHDGERIPDATFRSASEAYLAAALDAPPSGGRVPLAIDHHAPWMPAGDYYFDVLDPATGGMLSVDDPNCRRFHVGGLGTIEFVFACTERAHVLGRDPRDGGLTIQLAPFDDASEHDRDAHDGMAFVVRITPTTSYPLEAAAELRFRARASAHALATP